MKQNNLSLNVLQAQVYDLSAAVQAHWTKDEVIAEFGIRIIGQLENTNLPPISTEAPPPGGPEAFGEAYAVGVEPPYDIYIWTRPDAYHTEAYWFNIGKIAIAGEQGAPGISITNAALNNADQLVFTFSNGRVITIPRSLKGDPGGSPSVTLTTNDEGVIIKVLNPDGTLKQSALVRNGVNGQSIRGEAGPPGFFNILGTLQNEEQLPPAASVPLGSAYLVWHAIAAEENGGHYDLWLNITSGGTQAWQNTGRVAAGTYIYQDGQIVNTFDADTKVDTITGNSAYRIYGVKPNGVVWNPTVRTDPQSTNSNYKYQLVCYDITSGKSVNNGLIQIAETPLEDYHTASKKYVDDKSKLYEHNIKVVGENSGDSFEVFERHYNHSSAPEYYLNTGPITALSGYTSIASEICPVIYGQINTDSSGLTVTYIRNGAVESSNFDGGSWTVTDTVRLV